MKSPTPSCGGIQLVAKHFVGLGLLLIAATAPTLLAEPAAPAASLEARIDGLLKQMTTQEKIEQLFYKTDGNARLGHPAVHR